jgi:hypothetical protein
MRTIGKTDAADLPRKRRHMSTTHSPLEATALRRAGAEGKD